MYLFYAVCIAVFFAAFAMTVREGLWHNIVLLGNLMLGAVIAFGFYQPLTILLDEATGGEYTYLLDLLVFWGLFAISVALLKATGVALSNTRIKFLHPLEQYGGPFFGFLCGVVMSATAGMSLHMAPLAKDTMGGALVHEDGAADSPSLITGSPDLAFLAAAGMFTNPTGTGGAGQFESGPWVKDYTDRRERFEGVMGAAKAAWSMRATRAESR